MVSSTNYTVAITQGHGSGVIGADSVKFNGKKEEEPKKVVKVPDAKIKYRKIKQSDKYSVHGEWSEDYVVTIEVETSSKELERSQELMNRYRLITFRVPNKKTFTYLKSCYKIDSIESPQRYQGAGTKALQALLDRSLADKDTQGRMVVYAEVTDGKTSPAGFFYKLGFRFLDKSMNEVMEKWVQKKIKSEFPQITGMMYLPKNNINKLMMYGRNFL